MQDSIAIVVIVALMFLIGVLLWFIQIQLREFKRAKQTEANRHSQEEAGRQSAISSSRVLARCVVEDQIEYSEACIRLNVLLDAVLPELHAVTPYDVFARVSRELEAHPTHLARNDLPLKERRALDLERMKIEGRYREEILQAAKNLLQEESLVAT